MWHFDSNLHQDLFIALHFFYLRLNKKIENKKNLHFDFSFFLSFDYMKCLRLCMLLCGFWGNRDRIQKYKDISICQKYSKDVWIVESSRCSQQMDSVMSAAVWQCLSHPSLFWQNLTFIKSETLMLLLVNRDLWFLPHFH